MTTTNGYNMPNVNLTQFQSGSYDKLLRNVTKRLIDHEMLPALDHRRCHEALMMLADSDQPAARQCGVVSEGFRAGAPTHV